MSVAQHFITVVAFLVCTAGCADDNPVRATYVPADCPPCAASGDMAEADAEPTVIEITPEEVDPTGEGAASEETAPEEPESVEAGERININTAGELALIELPGVGPALAGRIVAYREKRTFKAPDELRRVRGIGPAKFAKIEPLITVD